LCLDYLRAHARPGARFFFFLHFREPDHAGHQHGENSPEYEAALIDTDEWLGRIRQTLDELGVGATTAILVVTDHGFREDREHHKNARDAWLATNWAPVKRGNQRDLAPTILAAFGVELDQLAPPLPGQALWTSPD
jgi:arylsulfatase A-like enzyme